MVDYSRICFVIMPFGTKTVGECEINFDEIYDEIIEPAVNATSLPAAEGGNLESPGSTCPTGSRSSQSTHR